MNRGSPPLSTQHLFGLARGIIEQPLGVVEYLVVRLEKVAGDGRAALQQGIQMVVDPSQVVGARSRYLAITRFRCPLRDQFQRLVPLQHRNLLLLSRRPSPTLPISAVTCDCNTPSSQSGYRGSGGAPRHSYGHPVEAPPRGLHRPADGNRLPSRLPPHKPLSDDAR